MNKRVGPERHITNHLIEIDTCVKKKRKEGRTERKIKSGEAQNMNNANKREREKANIQKYKKKKYTHTIEQGKQ